MTPSFSRIAPLILGLLITSAGWCQEEDDDTEDKPAVVTSSMKMELTGGMKLEGSPVGMDAIKVNSLFGEAELPLHTVAGIRFAQKSGEQTTIVLQNGDVLTGTLAMDTLKCVAEWGQATVNTTHLVSVVFRPDLTWAPVSTPNGTRWRLTRSQGGTTQGGGSTRTVPQTFQPSR